MNNSFQHHRKSDTFICEQEKSGENTKKNWHVGTLTYTTGGLVVLFLWLLGGDFAWSMKERAVTSIASILVKSYGISDFFYGLLIVSLPNFMNMILGPIISYKSDRHRGRFGRRIPFLVFTTPFVVVGVIGIGFASYFGRQVHILLGSDIVSINTASLLIFSVFWIILDFGTTLTNALFTALVNDVVPRCVLGRFFAFFRAISLGAGIIFNYCLLGKVDDYGMYICIGLGVLYGTGLGLVCMKVKEGEYSSPDIPGISPNKGFIVAAKNYFLECFSHPYYRWVFMGYAFCMLANMPINIFSIFYGKSLGMPMDDLGFYLAVTYVISFFLCFLLGDLADRFHPIRMGILSIILYALVMLSGGIWVSGKFSFGIFLMAHGVISGAFMTLTASYGQRLFPQSLFAQFNSAMQMLFAIGVTIMAPLVGYILDILGNDYRNTFWIGLVLALFGLVSLLKVYRSYLIFGGDANYVPPSPMKAP